MLLKNDFVAAVFEKSIILLLASTLVSSHEVTAQVCSSTEDDSRVFRVTPCVEASILHELGGIEFLKFFEVRLSAIEMRFLRFFICKPIFVRRNQFEHNFRTY